MLSYEELNIAEFQIIAIVDEKTSNICRNLNGQTFQTEQAVSYVKEVLSTDPEKVVERFPWDNGNNWPVAGQFNQEQINRLYENMATKLPPFHGHCRTTIVARTIHNVIQNKTTSKDVSKAVNDTLDSIDRVHKLPDTVGKISIEESNQPNAGWFGRFIYNSKTMEPVKLLLNTGPDEKHYELTVAHEIGHFLDLVMLGDNPKEFASIADKKLKPLRDAARQTEAISTLWKIKRERRLPDGKELHPEKYKILVEMLKETEVSTRSYGQWIAKKSGNTILQKQVKEIVDNENILIRLSQWTDKDFLKIEKALDEIFKEEDWLK